MNTNMKGNALEESTNLAVSPDDVYLLMKRYGMRFQTAIGIVSQDVSTKAWTMKMLEIAYNKGKSHRKQ